MLHFLIHTIIDIFVAVIASWFTVQLSLKKFQNQILWKRKFEVYIKIIESLHSIKQCVILEKEFSLKIKDKSKLTSDQKLELTKKYDDACSEVSKFHDMAELIISKKATLILKEYFKSIGSDVKNLIEACESIENAADECLKNIIPVAKKDLESTNQLKFITALISKITKWGE